MLSIPKGDISIPLDKGGIEVSFVIGGVELIFYSNLKRILLTHLLQNFSYNSRYNTKEDKISMISRAWESVSSRASKKAISPPDISVIEYIYNEIEKAQGRTSA